MKAVVLLVKRIQIAAGALIGMILALMMCIILLQTFTRYVIFHSLPWSEELSRYLFVALVCLGINIGVANDLMIRIDNIDNILSAKMKHIFEIGRLVVELFVSVMFFISTFDMIRIGKFQKSAAMRIPMHYMYGVLTLGFGLAIIAVLLKLIETIRQKEA
jgi:TRAP-type C4-dicarboxylate transport system permease small subunit